MEESLKVVLWVKLQFFFVLIATSKDLPLQASNKRRREGKAFVSLLGQLVSQVIWCWMHVCRCNKWGRSTRWRQEIVMIIFPLVSDVLYLFYRWFPLQNWTRVRLYLFIGCLQIWVGKALCLADRCTKQMSWLNYWISSFISVIHKLLLSLLLLRLVTQ